MRIATHRSCLGTLRHLCALNVALFGGTLCADQLPAIVIRVDTPSRVYEVGRRIKGISIHVSTPFGEPVRGAIVTCLLPTQGPSGTFRSGLTAALLQTDPVGVAELPEFRLNRFAGKLAIELVVVRGVLKGSDVLILNTVPALTERRLIGFHNIHVLRVAAIAGVATMAAVVFSVRVSSSRPATPQKPTIGPPTITVGNP
jgi:hypothetical protein